MEALSFSDLTKGHSPVATDYFGPRGPAGLCKEQTTINIPSRQSSVGSSAVRSMEQSDAMSDFYDSMSGLYHLIFEDWDESIARQAGQLAAIIEGRWGADTRSILDVSCGIGTQSIGLAQRGFLVTASDLSERALARARAEAQRRAVEINFSVCDMRAAHIHHQREFDVVISVDNCITHLLNDDDLLQALRQIHGCTRPGGGCLLTVRDYDQEQRGTGLIKPYGVREADGKRTIIFQVWDFVGQIYDMTMYFVEDDRTSEQLVTHVMRTRYNAVGTDKLLALMCEAGFTAAERLDGCFYQPVLVGNRKP
jgi:2-polyprenyl-3-methyl-5-hydroxy-6-metoxy-1,4-benzoquinol methylase